MTFASESTNLVPGARDGVYIHNLLTRKTELISLATDATMANNLSWGPAVSGDGRYVAFMSR